MGVVGSVSLVALVPVVPVVSVVVGVEDLVELTFEGIFVKTVRRGVVRRGSGNLVFCAAAKQQQVRAIISSLTSIIFGGLRNICV